VLSVRATKTRTARLVPVSAEAVALLAAYVREERPKALPHDAVFVNLGRRGFGRPLRYRAWVAVCERARAAAGTPRVHAHAFRHTLATNLAEGGLALDALRRLLGHRNLDTVLVYDRVRDGRLYREYRQAMQAMQTTQAREGHTPPNPSGPAAPPQGPPAGPDTPAGERQP
jgi:site-specific recombinase XerD